MMYLRLHLRSVLFCGCFFLLASVCLGQSSINLDDWNHFDSTSTSTIDHSTWQSILDTYLNTEDPSGIHLFDYQALHDHDADLQRLDEYLTTLQTLDPRQYARDVQMAYWLNLYNALTIKTVAHAYPVESIMEIHDGENPGTGPWKDVRASVNDIPLTLDNIEHDILRPIWQDYRIHYGVNCASLGCPNLASEAFTKSNLEQLLDECARDFVNHVRAIEILDEAFGVTSSLYFWYMEDFGNSEDGIMAHFMNYAEDDLAQQLRDFNGILDHEYDWRLNDTLSQ